MNSKNKPAIANSRKNSPLRKISNLVSSVVGSILISFPVYDNNVYGFESYLHNSIRADTFEREKDIGNSIVIYCVDGIGESIEIGSELGKRIQEQRLFMIQRLQDFGIERDIPEFGVHNLIRCELEPSYTSGCPIFARVVSDTNMMFRNGSIRDSTIRHEIGHFIDNPNAPSWMREYAADFIAGIDSRTGSYSLSHIWARALGLDQSLDVLFNDNIDKKEISSHIKNILQDRLGDSFGNLDTIVSVLMESAPSELLHETLLLLNSSESDIWINFLGIEKVQLQDIIDRNPCLQNNRNTSVRVLHRIKNYSYMLGLYFIMKLEKVL